jgi:hydrogenase 3 maturation protease
VDWKTRLAGILSKRAVIVGVGNPLKGDDGVGPLVVSRAKYPRKLDAGTVPENFIFQIRKSRPEAIVIVDAADFGGKPGEVRLFPAGDARNPKVSTHAMPLSVFAAFFPESEVWLLGIQPVSNAFGAPPCPEAEASAFDVISAIGPSRPKPRFKRGKKPNRRRFSKGR